MSAMPKLEHHCQCVALLTATIYEEAVSSQSPTSAYFITMKYSIVILQNHHVYIEIVVDVFIVVNFIVFADFLLTGK